MCRTQERISAGDVLVDLAPFAAIWHRTRDSRFVGMLFPEAHHANPPADHMPYPTTGC